MNNVIHVGMCYSSYPDVSPKCQVLRGKGLERFLDDVGIADLLLGGGVGTEEAGHWGT